MRWRLDFIVVGRNHLQDVMVRSRGKLRDDRQSNHTRLSLPLSNSLPLPSVLSFISTFGGPRNEAGNRKSSNSVTPVQTPPEFDSSPDTPSPPPDFSPVGPSGSPRAGGHGSRPASMVFSHNPPQMRQGGDTPAELLPIFSFINTHMNKVYHEGYFLKLNDLDSSRSSPRSRGLGGGQAG